MFSFRNRIGWIELNDESIELRGMVTESHVKESAVCLADFLTARSNIECRVFELDDSTYFVGCHESLLLYHVGMGFDRIVATKMADCPFDRSVLDDYVSAYLLLKN